MFRLSPQRYAHFIVIPGSWIWLPAMICERNRWLKKLVLFMIGGSYGNPP